MKYAITGCLTAMLVSFAATFALAEIRQWTSSDGKFKVDAELIRHDEQSVTLKKDSGETIEVPLARLSDSDRKFIESVAAKAKPEASLEAGEPLRLAPRATLKGHSKAVRCLTFSPDGKQLASGGGNLKPGANNPGELILWSPATEKRIATLPNQGGRVRALVYSPNGKFLVAAYEPENFINRGLTVVWNLPAKAPKQKIPFAALSAAFSTDGDLLVLGGVEPPPPTGGRAEGGVRTWDVKNSRLSPSMSGHIAHVESVAISPDGRTIASASQDKALLWELETRKVSAKFEERLGLHPAMAISPDGTTLAIGARSKSSSTANEVALLDLKTAKVIKKIDVGDNINAMAFSHNGKTLAVGTGWASEGDVILLDPKLGEQTARLRGHQGSVMGVAFSPDDKTLATGSTDGAVNLWDLPAKKRE